MAQKSRTIQVLAGAFAVAALASCRPVSPPLQDALAKTDLAYAMSVARQNFGGSFVEVDAAEMEQHGPSLAYVDGAGTKTEVGITAQTDATILFTKQGGSGTWFCIAANGDATTYGSGATYGSVNSIVECANPNW